MRMMASRFRLLACLEPQASSRAIPLAIHTQATSCIVRSTSPPRRGLLCSRYVTPVWLVVTSIGHRSHGHSAQIKAGRQKCSRATTGTWGLGRRGRRRRVVDVGSGRGGRGREGRGGPGRGRREGLGKSFQVSDDDGCVSGLEKEGRPTCDVAESLRLLIAYRRL